MIFFTQTEILNSVLAFLILGFLFGALYMAGEALISFFEEIVFLLPNTFKKLRKKEIIKYNHKKPIIIKNVFEGFLFFVYIIITIFALYVFLDGILRIYPLLIMVFAFLIGKSTLGRGANSILSFCLTKFYKFISFIIYLIALPIYHIFVFFIKVLIKRFAPCLLKIKRRKSKIKVRKKIKYAKREIKELLTK